MVGLTPIPTLYICVFHAYPNVVSPPSFYTKHHKWTGKSFSGYKRSHSVKSSSISLEFTSTTTNECSAHASAYHATIYKQQQESGLFECRVDACSRESLDVQCSCTNSTLYLCHPSLHSYAKGCFIHTLQTNIEIRNKHNRV